MIDTNISNRSDFIRLVNEMLEKVDRKSGGLVADIRAGLEALLDAIRREVV
jgi:hypothetical protein